MTHLRDARDLLVELEARPGPWGIGCRFAPLRGWMYNGDVPGPVLDARVGDTLIVRLTNELPEPTSFHVSGSSVPASKRDAGATRRMVQSHATAEYRFMLPDAGTFWYGPTNNAVQIERGLYGVLVVRGDDEPSADAERVLVFDDVCLGRHGKSAVPHRCGDDCEGDTSCCDGDLRSCEGDVLLLNGRVQPQLVLAPGHVERWRFVNAAHARSVRFSLGRAPFRVIAAGADAQAQREVRQTMLAPGATGEVLVGPFIEGTLLHVQSLPDDFLSARRRLAHVFGTVIVRAQCAGVDSVCITT